MLDCTLERELAVLAENLNERGGGLNLSEWFMDGTFVATKRGKKRLWERLNEKGTKLMALAAALVFLSPYVWQVLRHTRSPSSSEAPSNGASLRASCSA